LFYRYFYWGIYISFSIISLNAETYVLEYSLTGTEVTSISSVDYQLETGWGEVPTIIDSDTYLAEFEVYGYLTLLQNAMTGESAILLTDGVEIAPGWKKAGWFGFFFDDYYPWVYHRNFGWVFIFEQRGAGAWLYNSATFGWLWTNPKIFPYLYLKKTNSWLYLNPFRNEQIFYDYLNEKWINLN
jgi:hypothetical protein